MVESYTIVEMTHLEPHTFPIRAVRVRVSDMSGSAPSIYLHYQTFKASRSLPQEYRCSISLVFEDE